MLAEGLENVTMEWFTYFWIRILKNYCTFTPLAIPDLENLRM